MQIRCPHCHAPFESVEQESWADILCPACGSSFSLTGVDATCTYRPGVQVLGHFELLQQVGVGRYGSVWKARDRQLQRTVAVKIPRQKDLDPQQTDVFLRDARAAAQLKHPRIASVHEVGRENNTVYIVTDFIDGCNLSEWLTGQRLTPRESAELVVKIAEALEHAHEFGVVHRDLKPSNIMLDRDGVPHVIDFGLARRETGEVAMTVDGQILGTPAYMSPEQARGEGHRADRRSDIYSLGVILFELLTGELPFRGDARMLIVQILNEEPPNPRKLNGRMPRDLETITLKCLEKDSNKRYQSAGDLADDLQRFLLGKSIQARPIGRLERGWRWCRRNPVVAGLAAAVFFILTVGVVTSSYFAASASREASATKKALAAAELQQKRAEGVNAFFTDAVFGQADPKRGGRAGIGLVEALTRAAEKIDQYFPDDAELRAVVHDRFGEVFTGIDEPKKAVEQFEAAVKLHQSLSGDLDPATLKSRANLGQALYGSNEFDESRESLKSVYADQIKTLGGNHPDVIQTAIYLGITLMELHDKDDLDFTEQTYRRALAVFGARHPLTLEAETNYSWVLRWRGEFAKALDFAEPAAIGLREIKGAENPRAMYAAYNHASCLYELGRYKEAADVFGPLLEVRSRVLGPMHVDSLYSAWRLADSLEQSGDKAGALATLEGVRANLQSIETTGNLRRCNPLQNIINVYLRLKRNDRAAEIQSVVAQMYEEALRRSTIQNIDFSSLRDLVATMAMSPQTELHDPERALEIAIKACELTEYKNSDAVSALVFAKVGNGDYESTIKTLDKLADQKPASAVQQYQFALIRLRGGDSSGYRAACNAMAKQFATSPQDEDRRWFTWTCGLGASSLEDLSLPIQIAKGLVAKAPENTTYQSALGILLYRLGSYDQAEKQLFEATAVSGKGGREQTSTEYPQFFLAMSKWKLGDKAVARRLLTEVQTAMDAELKSTPLWNRKATLELFRQEAEALIQPETSSSSDAKSLPTDKENHRGG